MRIAVLFSGGKDSCYTIIKSKEQDHEIRLLLTLIPKSNESWLFHHPCIQWTKLQAEAMELPISMFKVESQGEKEKEELREYLAKIKDQFGIEGIAVGALASQYQKSRFEEIAKNLGLNCFTPLWGRNPLELLHEQLARLDVIIVAVAALGLDHKWLGRRLDENSIGELKQLAIKYGINVSGEGGEYETFVLDTPLFKRKIVIKDYSKVWLGERGHLEIKAAELVNKN